MSIIKRPSAAVVLALLVLLGFGAALAGVYLLVGLAPTLIAGGVTVGAFGLLADL